MVLIPTLWLPILISAVIVFVASSLIHMVLGYHKNDFNRVPAEDELMEAMRRFELKPGDYMLPRPRSMADLKSAEFTDKRMKGPVAIMTVLPSGRVGMGPQLGMWFVYSLAVGVLAAYIAGRALGAGAPYLHVFRFAGCTAFIAYGAAHWPTSIWYGRSWGTTIRNTIDALVYGTLTAGTFGWLWPR